MKPRIVLGILAGMLAAGQAGAFSLLGPFETAWQTATLDFNPNIYQYGSAAIILGGSKNLGEEYRINTPVVTYAYDHTFLDYFGSNGVAAIDSAMAALNALPAASSASADLSEFPTVDVQRFNYTAQALNLVDLKSEVLWLMMERMGLAGETHVFDLRDRVLSGDGNACDYFYLPISRNFDPVTYAPVAYVNGFLVRYRIVDSCPTATPNSTSGVADAVEYSVDPLKPEFTCVATGLGLGLGGFYTGLSRDDFGGLRYSYRQNNLNNEPLQGGSIAGAVGAATVGGSGGNGSPWYTPATNATATGTTTGTTTGPTTVPTTAAAAPAPSPGAGTATELLGGVEKVTFLKMPYDSQFGTFFKPVTNAYTATYYTNNAPHAQTIRRALIAPDILFAAAELESPTAPPSEFTLVRTAMNFVTPVNANVGAAATGTGAGAGAVAAGPGIIPISTYPGLTAGVVITFNKVGPFVINFTQAYANENTPYRQGWLWGSFDQSTNDPVVYPPGTVLNEIFR